MTLALHSIHFLYPLKWCTYSAAWLLRAWCHMKLLLSWRMLCTPADNHAPVQSVTLFETMYIGCILAQLYPATCTFGRMTGSCFMLLQKHRGGTDTQIKFAHHSCNFSIVSLVIYHRPSYPHSLEADHSHNKVAHYSNRFSSTSLVLSHRVICAPRKLIIRPTKRQTI